MLGVTRFYEGKFDDALDAFQFGDGAAPRQGIEYPHGLGISGMLTFSLQVFIQPVAFGDSSPYYVFEAHTLSLARH